MALLCCRCHKNRAVLFVTRMDNGEMKNEGYCLKCAKELGLKPVDDLLENMGLQDADLDALCEQANQMGELMNVDENAANIGQTGVGNFSGSFSEICAHGKRLRMGKNGKRVRLLRKKQPRRRLINIWMPSASL